MQAQGPNEITMSNLLLACAHLGALEQGKWAHVYIEKNGIEVDVVLGTALIDMYAKCGSIERAMQVFDSVDRRDVTAWTAMITGLTMHGHTDGCFAPSRICKFGAQGLMP
ncbi:hypothetical protein AMTRI_Chr02g222590 [Amborella trichopoda]